MKARDVNAICIFKRPLFHSSQRQMATENGATGRPDAALYSTIVGQSCHAYLSRAGVGGVLPLVGA